MKVTKKGVIPSERIWRGSCRRCRCEVDAVERELPTSKIVHDQREGGAHCWMPCPECGTVEDALMLYPVRGGAS